MLFSDKELREILLSEDQDFLEELYKEARETANATFSNKIYIRALIEFSNYCKEGCYYCGINRNKSSVHRFHLSKEEIYSAAETAYEAGFRTFVLQGGEDTHFTDEAFAEIISYLKKNYDAAITLSLGVRSYDAYKLFKDAGADRFLLRHETADVDIFQKLHPWDQSLERRLKAIYDLKELGYQVGTGFMVAAPFTNHESHIK
ncbi:MAG: radical SAM protein, partial [Fenollaria timonensis]